MFLKLFPEETCKDEHVVANISTRLSEGISGMFKTDSGMSCDLYATKPEVFPEIYSEILAASPEHA